MRLRTEGSNRWEKGVDPYLAEQAAVLATQLLVELTGARWTGHTDVQGELPERALVPYRPEKADQVVGLEISRDEQEETLERIGCELEGSAYRVPTWRARDLTREIDLVEEVARFVLDDVPFTLPLRRAMTGRLTREQRMRRRLEDALVGLGFAEAVTPSLRADDREPGAIRLEEPISSELADPANRAPAEPGRLRAAATSRRGTGTSPCSRSHTSISHAARSFPRSRFASPGSSKEGSPR